jgi:hypothetical protein
LEEFKELLVRIDAYYKFKPKSFDINEYDQKVYSLYVWHFSQLLGCMAKFNKEDRRRLTEGKVNLLKQYDSKQESQFFIYYFSLVDWAQIQEVVFSQLMNGLNAFASNRGLIMPANWGALLEEYFIENNTLEIQPHLFSMNEDMVLKYAVRKTMEYDDKILELKEDEKYEDGYVRYLLLNKIIDGDIDLKKLIVKQKDKLYSSIIRTKNRSIKSYSSKTANKNSRETSIHFHRANQLLENIKKGNIM